MCCSSAQLLLALALRNADLAVNRGKLSATQPAHRLASVLQDASSPPDRLSDARYLNGSRRSHIPSSLCLQFLAPAHLSEPVQGQASSKAGRSNIIYAYNLPKEWGAITKVKTDFVMSGNLNEDKIFGNENARSGSISRRPH